MVAEKRRSHRHNFTCEIECTPSNGHAPLGQPAKALVGRVLDIGAGGIGVVVTEPFDLFAPVQVRFRIPTVPAPIPSLVQVRWIQPIAASKGAYRLGLSYLV